MRIDSQNLLDKLGQPDFEYRDFHANQAQVGEYGWPLLDLVSRALEGVHAAVPPQTFAAAAVSPVRAAPAAHGVAPAGHGLFAHYGRPAAAAVEPAPSQDLESLLQSYSGRR